MAAYSFCNEAPSCGWVLISEQMDVASGALIKEAPADTVKDFSGVDKCQLYGSPSGGKEYWFCVAHLS